MERRATIYRFVNTRRGPSCSALLQDEDGTIYIGTVFFEEVGANAVAAVPSNAKAADKKAARRVAEIAAGVSSATAAIRFLEEHFEMIRDGLKVSVDDGIYPGWSRDPRTEQTMLERCMREAGW